MTEFFYSSKFVSSLFSQQSIFSASYINAQYTYSLIKSFLFYSLHNISGTSCGKSFSNHFINFHSHKSIESLFRYQNDLHVLVESNWQTILFI